MTESRRTIYAVKAVADYVGVGERAIVAAEKAGRIPKPARYDELGARYYDVRERDRIGEIMGRR